MISTQFVSRISLQRDKVDSFDRYPFVSFPVKGTVQN